MASNGFHAPQGEQHRGFNAGCIVMLLVLNIVENVLREAQTILTTLRDALRKSLA